ncbi:CAAX prenyl protease-like protein [Actimicrobium sp. GrIS 1.19]|uniref:CAAX prenyl protease-related protein n=1 Tax=Actimicrobium sp. GrIS 1.19 TaxID=3071708 RepID=UPI002DF8F88C|nr:CAAX prenyl protease-like protein [Actimicrobium sp. GrIS 1.19]
MASSKHRSAKKEDVTCMKKSSGDGAGAVVMPTKSAWRVRLDKISRRPSTPRILPFAVYIFFTFVVDMLERLDWGGDGLRWMYGVKIAFVAATIWFLRNNYDELRSASMPRRKDWLIVIAAGAGVFVAWINLGAAWMVVGTPTGFDPRGVQGIDWELVAVRLTGAALIVPVMEELFWRSFLLRWLEKADFLAVDPARVGLKAFAITAVFFAFEHNLWLAGLLAAVVYAGLYMRTRNLWSPVIAHGVTNAMLGCWIVATGNWIYW